MADQESNAKPSEAPDGVFGNLPAARPGTRSPRRRTGGASTERAEPASEPRVAKPPPAPPPPPRQRPAPSAEETQPPTASGAAPGQRIGSVEDLAWAGIAVAAQAATVGVKFASRALEAARKSVDRPD